MFYALIADDTDDPQKRMDARSDHLKHLDVLGDRLVLAGPFITENGAMTGSFMVIEADSQAEAEAIYAEDPYVKSGVFANYTVRPFKLTINKSAGR
ncbi:hypothetical protein GCM10007989_18890 [Devosia pacifica]|uniref:YCII-related domain-containing protein n=1 Tax=Devosia pacifica TaxID=1335967 RepID=A0A918VTV9_9HYPH|nr:YciI family protein [Devosia pacifica]GHA23624.1 hypothetical protein GCM10007989_18890 [Devosia pacifica]